MFLCMVVLLLLVLLPLWLLWLPCKVVIDVLGVKWVSFGMWFLFYFLGLMRLLGVYIGAFW